MVVKEKQLTQEELLDILKQVYKIGHEKVDIEARDLINEIEILLRKSIS